MFTSQPTLAERLERLIDDTSIVDPHTHIRVDQPHAPDLLSLLSYHWVQTELIAVGMPNDHLDPALPADELVKRLSPYLARMRNTAMAWCVSRIFRDLYDHFDPLPTRSLFDAVAKAASDPNRGWNILRERCGVETFVTSLGNASQDKKPDFARFMLDAHYLFCPGVATDLTPFFPGRTKKSEYIDAIQSLFGEHPSSAARLKRNLFDWLDRTIAGPTRFSNTFIPIEQRFSAVDDARVDHLLLESKTARGLIDSEIDELVRFVSWNVLAWHHENRKAFQIAVGAEYFICDGKSIPRFQETWTSDMARVFHHFGNVRFDIMMASDVLSHEVAVLARQFPNVYASGYWWHNFFPITIEKIITSRLQIAPMTKFGGFFCDAYYAEWSYGKLQIVKKAMAAALRQVEARFLDEDDIPAILTQILHDTPRDLYDLA